MIEDDSDFLESLVLLLEENNFEVKSAQNGADALEMLKKINPPPDLIISDIKMPGMDGYELFVSISKDPKLNEIPFIFLSALSDSKQIRIGKRLGIDDYLTKPIREKMLLAAIKGKLNRKKIIHRVNKRMNTNLANLDLPIGASVSDNQKDEIWMLEFLWDDKLGPKLIKYHPKIKKYEELISRVGIQCFSAITAIYGPFNTIREAQDLLINLENVKRKAYLLFDSLTDPDSRTKKKAFMLGVIAPSITYYDSLLIKQILKKLSIKIKLGEEFNFGAIWEQIANILTK